MVSPAKSMRTKISDPITVDTAPFRLEREFRTVTGSLSLRLAVDYHRVTKLGRDVETVSSSHIGSKHHSNYRKGSGIDLFGRGQCVSQDEFACSDVCDVDGRNDRRVHPVVSYIQVNS